ncbi:MAG: hypothetical protein KGL59_02950 [Acidobacteriota bacterium]|nr:hypothetical protein [Acidobacteriota bacterium]
MAGTPKIASLTEPEAQKRTPGVAAGFAIAGWLVPGLGHVLAGRPGRGVIYFLTVAALAITGFLQRGFVFSHHFVDAFSLLGFLADAGTGIFYFAAKIFELGGPDIARAAGDYGTRFIATAGVLNVLIALDAYSTAIGEKD